MYNMSELVKLNNVVVLVHEVEHGVIVDAVNQVDGIHIVMQS